MAKLSTPTGVSVDEKILKWNDVTNATRYSIHADGISLGAVGEIERTHSTYRVTFPTDESLTVTIKDSGGNVFAATSGFTLYSNDTITITKMGSTKRLYVNGVSYDADNTVNNVSLHDTDIEITLEDGMDAGGDNTATVVVAYSLYAGYTEGLLYLGNQRVYASYLGSVRLKNMYVGTKPLLNTQDTYSILAYNKVNATSAATKSSVRTSEMYTFTVQSETEHYKDLVVKAVPDGACTIKVTESGTTEGKRNWSIETGKYRSDTEFNIVAPVESYAVTFAAGNFTVSGSSTIDYGGTQTYHVTANNGYLLPQTITCTGATANWDAGSDYKTATLTLSNPTTGVLVTIQAAMITYALTDKLTNCTATHGVISIGALATSTTLTYKVINAGYAFPTSITVTGASDYTWNAGSGTLVLGQVTAPVTVTIAAVAKTFTINWYGTNCTPSGAASGSIKGGQTLDKVYTINDNLFALAESDFAVTNVQYSYIAASKTLRVSNPTGNVTARGIARRVAYTLSASGINCTITGSTGYISVSGTTTLTVAASSGFYLDSDAIVTVSGATYTWDATTGKLALSAPTANVTVSVSVSKHVYSIDLVRYHLFINSISEDVNVPTQIVEGTRVSFTVHQMIGYQRPTAQNITCDGASFDYSYDSAKVTIYNPTKNVTMAIAAPAKVFNVKTSLTGCTGTGPSTVAFDENVTWTFTAKTGYELPSNVTVTNGSKISWNSSTGQLVFGGALEPVTLTVIATQIKYNVTNSLTNCTADSSNPTKLAYGSSATFKFTAADGYEIITKPTVTNATVSELTYPTAGDKSVATVTISNPIGAVTITLAATKKAVKLATPTNVSIDGKTVSWDEVTNATKYLIKLDGTEVGTTTGGGFTEVTPIVTSTYAELTNMDASKVYTLKDILDTGFGNAQFPTINVQHLDNTWTASDKYLWIKSQTATSIRFVYDYSKLNDESYGKRWRGDQVVKILEGDSIAVDADFAKFTNTANIPTWYIPCYSKGSQITLADGSTKNVEDVTYDDNLLVWNFYEGKFDSAKPIWVKKPQTINYFLRMHFSNGSTLELIGPGEVPREDGVRAYHRIYNNETQKFTYTGFDDTPIGTHTFADDGSFPELLKQEVIHEPVGYYNIITEKHFNVFVNGICTSCVLSNMYEIQDMKYVGERLISEENEQKYYEHLKEIDLTI